MPLKQKDLITSHFTQPNSGDGRKTLEYVTTRPVKQGTKRDIISAIIVGGDDVDDKVEKRFEAKDIVTAFLYGTGITLFLVVTLLYSVSQ